jgi:hypothetical protein
MAYSNDRLNSQQKGKIELDLEHENILLSMD